MKRAGTSKNLSTTISHRRERTEQILNHYLNLHFISVLHELHIILEKINITSLWNSSYI